jgi:hypothetical protein
MIMAVDSYQQNADIPAWYDDHRQPGKPPRLFSLPSQHMLPFPQPTLYFPTFPTTLSLATLDHTSPLYC